MPCFALRTHTATLVLSVWEQYITTHVHTVAGRALLAVVRVGKECETCIPPRETQVTIIVDRAKECNTHEHLPLSIQALHTRYVHSVTMYQKQKKKRKMSPMRLWDINHAVLNFPGISKMSQVGQQIKFKTLARAGRPLNKLQDHMVHSRNEDFTKSGGR